MGKRADDHTVEAPRRKRRGGRPRTRTKNIPRLPKSEKGVAANPELLEEPQLSLENLDFWKKSDCRFYVRCLDHAAKRGWIQFHCRSCKIYEIDEEADKDFRDLAAKMRPGAQDPIY